MKVYLFVLLLIAGLSVNAHAQSRLRLYKNEKGRIEAEGIIFAKNHVPKTQVFKKASKRGNGHKVVEFEGLDYILEYVGGDDYNGIQGFPAVNFAKLRDVPDTLILPDVVVIQGEYHDSHGYFMGSNVKKIIFSPSIKFIGERAFAYSPNLKEVVFPDGCNDVEIDKNAFKGCKNLQVVRVPKGQVHAFAQKLNLPLVIFFDENIE